MRRCLPALAIAVALTTAVEAERLPASVLPTHYTLWFAPDLDAATFRGRETIEVTVPTPTTSITLNAAELAFTSATISSGGRTQTANVETNEKSETATLTVPQPIDRGSASVQISYTGILNDKLRGFYLSQANGRRYAVTQMEATDARRAFAGWDEPAFKATFDISVMVDTGDTAISNGAAVSDTPGPEPGKHTIVFGRTAKISTYLVAMLVGDFACRDRSADGIAVRVCSTPDKLPLTGFALDSADQALRYFNEWTGIRYPFGKLDLIGVPDFAAGAMENAGAITFREEELLADPQGASLRTRKTVASVIAHEIAHQWFGDLVTMKWWDDVWLNEGFATWMANKPLAASHPEWQIDIDEVDETQSAVSTDALRSTRPVHTQVDTPEEINQVFDAVAYQKTASILRMLENYVGPELFRKGVQSYLHRYSFANAAGQDFWNEVTRATGKPVDRIMAPFIEQPGVPVIGIDARCQDSATDVSVRTERFTGITEPAADAAALRWAVPVCFRTGEAGRQQCELVHQHDQRISLNGCPGDAFANAGGRGYYVSEYPPGTVRSIARTALDSLTAPERLTLIDDEWWMARAGRHDIGVYLDAASALAADRTPSVLEQISRSLAETRHGIVRGTDADRFEEWIRRRFGPELTTVGLPGSASDPDDVQSRRATLLALVGRTGNSRNVQEQARGLALRYVDDPASLPATIASQVLAVAAIGGDSALYERYTAQLIKYANNPELYYRFLSALPAFRSPALVERTLDFAISPAVRTQDTAMLLGSMLAQRDGEIPGDGKQDVQRVAWQFVKGHWDTLTGKLGIFQGLPGIMGATGALCSADLESDVRQFFADHPVPGVERIMRQSLERIQNCVAIRDRQAGPASAWLATAAR